MRVLSHGRGLGLKYWYENVQLGVEFIVLHPRARPPMQSLFTYPPETYCNHLTAAVKDNEKII